MADNLLNVFLKKAPIKYKKNMTNCFKFLCEKDVIRIDMEQNKFFVNLPLIEHIFDKRFILEHEITLADMVSLYHHYMYDAEYGYIIWILKKHNKMPRQAVADFLNGLRNYRNKPIYELALLNLKGNPEP